MIQASFESMLCRSVFSLKVYEKDTFSVKMGKGLYLWPFRPFCIELCRRPLPPTLRACCNGTSIYDMFSNDKV